MTLPSQSIQAISSNTALTKDQLETLAEFKQDLASISATAGLEWKENEQVLNLIEQMERTVQQTSSDTLHLFKTHVKYLFQESGITISFTKQNLIERLKEVQLRNRNQLSKISEQMKTAKESLDQPIASNIQDATTIQGPILSQTNHKKIKNIAYWKRRLSKKAFKGRL